jgi:C4-dicarboxylate-specific signal transduction histidine kinase
MDDHDRAFGRGLRALPADQRAGHRAPDAAERDVTGRQSARPSVLSEELRAQLDALPMPVLLLGDDDEILHANPAMRERRGSDLHHAPNPQMQRLASLGFMLAGVCHEVSNPLAAIHSMVQILQSHRGVTPATLEKGLESIASNIARVLAITRKLGDFSRLTGDAPGALSVDSAVHEAAALLRHSRCGAQVRVEYDALPGVLTLARPGELQQVILNLLMNAAQAMQGSGRIEVRAELLAEGRIRLSVRDEGPGIAPEQLERVFEPFFTTKPPGEGTGLGLAISYEIVHELGGTMRAANHAGGGACLQVDLPRHEAQP